MLDFMENVQHAFYEASHWNVDNSYGALNATARGRFHLTSLPPSDANCLRIALLDFDIPRGLRLQISSLAAPNFATSYTLGSVGVVDGSVSYLYSSLPLRKDFKSSKIDLHHVIRGYKHLQELRRPDEKWWWEMWHAGRRVDRKSGVYCYCLPDYS
jgi:distribution and morphology protein 10